MIYEHYVRGLFRDYDKGTAQERSRIEDHFVELFRECDEKLSDICDLGCGIVHSLPCEAPIPSGGKCTRAFHHSGGHKNV